MGLKARQRYINLALGLSIKGAAKQGANELNVSCFVERRNFDALAEHFKATIALRWQDGAQSLEQLLPQLIEAMPLATQPVVEQRNPVDGEALEKVATEQCSQRLKVRRQPAGQRRLSIARK
jgi:hypothetical protein